jgi:hypothetical protein
MWMEIVDLAAREDPELHRKLVGFPGDLPNVARLRQLGGNSRLDGIEQSYFCHLTWPRECGSPSRSA